MATADNDHDDITSGAQHFLTCDECESRPAVHYCQMCPGDLCEECGEKHKKVKLFKNHIVIPLIQSRTLEKDRILTGKDCKRSKRLAPSPTLSVTLITGAEKQLGLTRLSSTRMLVGCRDGNIRDLEISGKQNPNITLNLSPEDSSYGLTVMNDKSILFLDRHNKKIYKYTTDNPRCLFAETEWCPVCMYGTKSGHVLVGQSTFEKNHIFNRLSANERIAVKELNTIGKVVVYSESGEKKTEILENDGKRLYHCPGDVTESYLNRDVVVSDEEKRVVVVNELGRMRFTYYGVQSESNFKPWQVDTDCLGNILICDKNNKVHIISKDGQFISYLVTDEFGIDRPCGICFDGIDSVWIAEHTTKKVKVYKYLV